MKAKLDNYWPSVCEAYAKWYEADAKRYEADAKWYEADAKRYEADAKWHEAYAKWYEADAKRYEAHAKRNEADAKRNEAHANFISAAQKVCGKDVLIEWTDTGCIVAGVMEFLYKGERNEPRPI